MTWPTRFPVTRPLSQEEIKAQGWSTTDLCFDSRRLLHYVRLLPDGRFMFGGRGGWDASEKGKARMRVYMERTFKEMLPAWPMKNLLTSGMASFPCSMIWLLISAIRRAMTPSGARWPGKAAALLPARALESWSRAW